MEKENIVVNKYKIINNTDGYVDSFYDVLDDDYDYVGQLSLYNDLTEGWYKFINNEFIVDEDKKAEILEERRKEAEKPTQLDIVEAQLIYTAMMTDTLLEE